MSKNCIWITGADGKVGREVLKRLKDDTDHKIVATDREVNVASMEAVDRQFDMLRPDVVINCAGMTDIAACEENPIKAYRVNALGARNLAAATRRGNARIIHISTDDVFTGNQAGALTEFDAPNPTSVYGKSKLAGETFIRELNPKHLIVRSSWVYGIGDGDYYSYVISKAKAGEKFEAPVDVISSPTSAKALSSIIEYLMDYKEYGVFHASCEGACSRFEFARTVLELNGFDTSLVTGVVSSKDGQQNSTLLENLMLKMICVKDEYPMLHWRDELKSYINQI